MQHAHGVTDETSSNGTSTHSKPDRLRPCPECKPTVRTDTVYLTATEPLDSLQRELQIEQLANQAIRKKLGQAEEERDYWQQKNEQKFWGLVAMGVFGFLYILFTLLASRIKES